MWFPLLLLVVLLLACGGPVEAPAAASAAAPAAATGTVRLWQDARIFDAVSERMAAARAAKERIWVEMYEFERDDLAQLLLAAEASGCDVRLLVDPTVASSLKLATRLRVEGLPVRFYPVDERAHQIDHVKLLLAGASAVVGGMNWGRHSHLNHDYVLESRAPPLLARLAAIFEQDWNLAGGRPAPLASEGPPVAQTAPGDEIRGMLLADLAGSRRGIEAEVFVLTDPEILAGLIAAQRRGVRVRVLLDPNQDVNRPGFDLLRRHRLEVRWYPVAGGAKLHAKTGLFDGRRLVVGSANWSRGGLSINHELDLETEDATAVAGYRARFELDWARGY